MKAGNGYGSVKAAMVQALKVEGREDLQGASSTALRNSASTVAACASTVARPTELAPPQARLPLAHLTALKILEKHNQSPQGPARARTTNSEAGCTWQPQLEALAFVKSLPRRRAAQCRWRQGRSNHEKAVPRGVRMASCV